MMRPGEQDPRDLMQLRVPPQSIEAEQAVLGGLLLQPSAFSRIEGTIAASDFYRRDHQLIFEAISEHAERRKPFDAVILGDWFHAQGLAEQVANGAYLIELSTTTPSAANISAYADIVRDKAMRRRVIELGTDLVNEAFAGAVETIDLVGNAQTKFSSLMVGEPCELEPISPVMSRVWEGLTKRHANGGQIQGLGTGIDDLDLAINGLSPGLYVLAGRPKMGKTTLAQNIAEHLAIELHRPVAFFNFEMTAESQGDRMISSVGDIPADSVRRGTLDDHEWGRADWAIKKIQRAKIFMSRPRSTRIGSICAQIRRLKAKQPDLSLVVIDYLQLIETSGDNRAQGLGEVTRKLVLLAHELKLPILLLSQLNRDLEKRVDKRPIPADLRDSGAIEQDADVVIFVYRDEVYNPGSRYRGTAEIIVALQRNGPPAEVRARYRGDRFRFENLPSDWEPEPLPADPEGKKPARRGMGGRKGGNPAADAAAGAQ
ncbi:replicative DNA helicase [Lysobacter enzymogenes]|uniref:replicative DNA helicase n=1 Tax=Lysobacter enzymogenes TaxID=69 RepID=UPI0019D25523|nr:replicative DNA helicase [Lysobacter enzymogenes]MBN7138979.1 replicative DNA helicase [Lysobacter enzymogenes]